MIVRFLASAGQHLCNLSLPVGVFFTARVLQHAVRQTGHGWIYPKRCRVTIAFNCRITQLCRAQPTCLLVAAAHVTLLIDRIVTMAGGRYEHPNDTMLMV